MAGPVERPTTEDGYSPPTADGPFAEDADALPAPPSEPVLAIDLEPFREEPATPIPAQDLGYLGIQLPGDRRE